VGGRTTDFFKDLRFLDFQSFFCSIVISGSSTGTKYDNIHAASSTYQPGLFLTSIIILSALFISLLNVFTHEPNK
jgi:hypothetical protein